MNDYVYSGPPTAVTLGNNTEVILRTGRTVSLPDDNPWVQSLVAQGHLTPVKAAKKTQSKES